MGTEQLVRDAQAGDTLALHALLDELAPFVGRICGAIALDDGEDAAQEALTVVFRRLSALRDPAALHGWVRTIATREAVRIARRRVPVVAGGDEAVPARDDAELAGDVRDVLSRLSPERRAVLVLRDLEGLEEGQVAELLEIPEGTVKSRLFRARAEFRRRWTA